MTHQTQGHPRLRRVILVNRYFFPDLSATSQLATDLAIDLARRGIDVVAIASRQLYDDPAAHLDSFELRSDVRIRRVRTTRFGRRSLPGRTFDYMSFYLFAAVALWNETRRGSVILAMTDPPMLGVLAIAIAHLRGALSVQWLQDVFPEVAERLELIRSSRAASLLRRLRDWSLRRTDVVVVIGDRMASLVAPLCKRIPTVIPNWALEENGDSEIQEASTNRNALRISLALEREFIVGYSGNMGRAHRLDELIDAVALLGSVHDFHLLLIGDGAQRNSLQERANSHSLKNVTFMPYQARERLRVSLSAPDIHVVSLDERLEGLIVPSKFVGVIALGRPVLWIGAPDGEIGSLVRESGCGVCVPMGDVATLAQVLRELSEDHASGCKRLRAMSAAASSLWQERFTRAAALTEWARVVQRMDTQA